MQWLLELSAALTAESPRLFVKRILWAGKAFRARGLATEDLRSSLDCLRQVLGEELPQAAAVEAVKYVDQALESLAEPPPAEATGLDPDDPNGRLALRYLQEILEGDARRALDLVVAAVDDGLDPRTAYLEVLIPAQREVGEMWHLGDVNVAEEHYVTATTERAMSILAQRVDRQPVNGKSVIAAAVAGNTHGVAVRALADLFEMAGWRSVCLGGDVPVADLAFAAQVFHPDLLVLSASRTTHLKSVRESVEALRRLPDREVKILVGGVALDDSPDLWQGLGADGQADTLDAAVALGARLVGLA